MFGWRRKSEGFDWQGYVRTTIKLRREARRDRIDAARQAALDKAHAAGHAVAEGGKAAGKAAVAGAQAGAEQSVKGATWFVSNVARTFTVAFGPLFSGVRTLSIPLISRLKAFELAGPLALIGAIALTSGLYRAYAQKLDAEAWVASGIGLVLLLLAAPAFLTRAGVGASKAWAAGIGALCALGAAAVAVPMVIDPAKRPAFGSVGSISFLPRGASPVEGRANAVTGDTIRLNGALYRLSGIEAPERGQSCVRPGKRRWRCGEAAQIALERLVRAKTTVCKPSGGADAGGRTSAACSVEGKDIAGELVREGHVFAVASMIGGYGSLETEARTRKIGLWNGEAERPAEYRTKLWEVAKKASPDGCPIKGVISTAGAKAYLLPGARDYRKASVRTARGERWFCTEADATAAGWKLTEKL